MTPAFMHREILGGLCLICADGTTIECTRRGSRPSQVDRNEHDLRCRLVGKSVLSGESRGRATSPLGGDPASSVEAHIDLLLCSDHSRIRCWTLCVAGDEDLAAVQDHNLHESIKRWPLGDRAFLARSGKIPSRYFIEIAKLSLNQERLVSALDIVGTINAFY